MNRNESSRSRPRQRRKRQKVISVSLYLTVWFLKLIAIQVEHYKLFQLKCTKSTRSKCFFSFCCCTHVIVFKPVGVLFFCSVIQKKEQWLHLLWRKHLQNWQQWSSLKGSDFLPSICQLHYLCYVSAEFPKVLSEICTKGDAKS